MYQHYNNSNNNDGGDGGDEDGYLLLWKDGL